MVCGLAVVVLATAAAAQFPATRLAVVAGGPPAAVSGEVVPGQVRDYSLTAAAGERLAVTLAPREAVSAGTAVTVMRVKDGIATFVGQSSADGEWSGNLPEDGEYVIRVARDPSAGEHREEHAIRYTLSVSLSP